MRLASSAGKFLWLRSLEERAIACVPLLDAGRGFRGNKEPVAHSRTEPGGAQPGRMQGAAKRRILEVFKRAATQQTAWLRPPGDAGGYAQQAPRRLLPRPGGTHSGVLPRAGALFLSRILWGGAAGRCALFPKQPDPRLWEKAANEWVFLEATASLVGSFCPHPFRSHKPSFPARLRDKPRRNEGRADDRLWRVSGHRRALGTRGMRAGTGGLVTGTQGKDGEPN